MDWLLRIPGWEWWDVHFKYLRSKPVSPNNCNSMFIPSLRLQPAQFPSRLWCIWKGVTEKFKARKVTADSQWRKRKRDTGHHQTVNTEACATTPHRNVGKSKRQTRAQELKPVNPEWEGPLLHTSLLTRCLPGRLWPTWVPCQYAAMVVAASSQRFWCFSSLRIFRA